MANGPNIFQMLLVLISIKIVAWLLTSIAIIVLLLTASDTVALEFVCTINAELDFVIFNVLFYFMFKTEIYLYLKSFVLNKHTFIDCNFTLIGLPQCF